MLSMGRRILPTPSLSNFQVLSWVWLGSVTETRTKINDEAQSWKIPSLTRSRSTLASASIQSMILILRSSSFCWSSDFYIRRQSNSLWNFSSLFQCLIYGFLVSNIYKSSLVAHLTRPSYSKTVVLNTNHLTSLSFSNTVVSNHLTSPSSQIFTF